MESSCEGKEKSGMWFKPDSRATFSGVSVPGITSRPRKRNERSEQAHVSG
jgi:hypothetical protein